jgi:DNA-directed RNA polymerase specialized sigma24 family protein
MNDTASEPPDEELLKRIRRKKVNFAAAKEAWEVFYVRHRQFLYRCVLNADRVLVGYGIGTDDIVVDTFAKVWESVADSFVVPDGMALGESTLCCKAWLATIARNLVLDRLKSRKQDLVDPDENEELFTAPESAAEQYLGIYYNSDTRQSQPPRDVHDAFCKEWGITPEVLRKAYNRALKLLGEAYTTTPR